ncbi:LacI family transcriptional regulator [Niastella caeni]|uniref:LacI family transcriptional regulator n=1 Tax=Niastella caeni TaxID=2569763 RepID=A0A4S8HJD3_9BACT|nr:substrate-binding domain-containing protein [Niastella caeni]THU32952.1 LacI family transcriptional regulator [Niastella caeni]
MKRVSLKDIARIAGVSPSTVSFVLNGKAKQMRISETLASKIMEVAKKEGYHPNPVAVSLRTGKSQILGLIVESISGNFFASLSRIIEEEAARFGYKIVYTSTENNRQKGKELIGMLSQRQVDGYIITPTPGMEQDIKDLIADNKPVVLMDSYFPGIDVPHVLVNNYEGVKKGMNHLIEKGYRRIGFVTVDLHLVQMEERLKAYQDSMHEAGLATDNLVLTQKYEEEKELGIQQVTSFIQNTPDLEAVFFATNYLGLLGLESIHRLGLKLPDDLAMICFDDHDVFRLYPPGITCIRQPAEEIARKALELLMDQLGKGSNTGGETKIEISPGLVIRGTTEYVQKVK